MRSLSSESIGSALFIPISCVGERTGGESKGDKVSFRGSTFPRTSDHPADLVAVFDPTTDQFQDPTALERRVYARAQPHSCTVV